MLLALALVVAGSASIQGSAATARGPEWVPDGAGNHRLSAGALGTGARTRGSALEIDVDGVTLRARTASFGRVGAWADAGEGRVSVDGARVEIARDALLERLDARLAGIEQSWIVHASPRGDADLWIGVDFAGLHVQIAEDARSARLVDAGGVARLSYRNLRVTDATGRELAARMRVEAGSFGIRVEDRGATYPILVDPFLSTSDWSWTPSDSPAWAALGANSLVDHVGCGDFDGDGYTDVLVGGGYHGYAAGAPAGRIWLFRGSASGPSWPNPDWDTGGPLPQAGVSGVSGGSVFGGGLTVLGDVNGDGIDDFAVSQVNYNVTPPSSAEGLVHVYLGQAGGTPVLHWTFVGPSPGDTISAGKYVGDVDGDGKCEIAISRRAEPERVEVYRGWSAGAPGAPLWVLRDTDLSPAYLDASYTNNALGVQVCGDVDADGYADILVSAFRDANVSGRLFLFRGGPAGPVGVVPTWTAEAPGTPFNAQFSGSVAGDLDGNGYADVIAGDSGFSPNYQGRLFTFLSNPGVHGAALLPAAPSQSLFDPNASSGSFFASRREPAGDADGDGFADVVVGNGRLGAGSANLYVYRGSASGLVPTPVRTESTPQINSDFGWRVGPAGDVNGDGLNDAWTTARSYDGPGGTRPDEGAAMLFFGRRETAVVSNPATGAGTIAGAASSGFGTSVAMGDVNGDGVDDLLVGSPEFSNGESSEGRVELFLGNAVCGFRTAPDWSYESNVVGARLGSSVAIPGDLDNDGFTEVLVGAPEFGVGLAGRGKVFLFRGQPPCPQPPNQPCPLPPCSDFLTQTPVWVFLGSEVNARLGAVVAGAGDVNADGFADILVGAPGRQAGVVDRGAVHVFHGRILGYPASTPDATLDEGQLGARFGAAAATAGDVDRDGFSDVIVGAPGWSNGPVIGEGRAFLYRGGPSGLATTADWFYGALGVAGAALGSAVAPAGDVDADQSSSSGHDDVLVSAPGYPAGTGGTAYVFHGRSGPGPKLEATPRTILAEPQLGASHGLALSSAGDVNGDGFSDVLVGTPGFDNGSGANAGRVRLHLGSSTGVIVAPAWSHEGASANAAVGTWVAGGGDFDGDGYSDLAFGIPGLPEILIGGGYVQRVSGMGYGQRRVDDSLAVMLLGASDETANVGLSGSAGNPFQLSSTPGGRGRVRLEWEIEPLSGALDGLGLGQQSTYTDTGNPAGNPVRLFHVVGGLSATTAYQWRSRLQFQNPIFAHTRWLQLQGNGKRALKFRLGTDCNGTGQLDEFDTLPGGGSLDCNSDTIPDECQVPPICLACADCNGNFVPDECELFGNDCDSDGVPNDCEADCDGLNGADVCEILANPTLDTNGDGVLDACQTAVSIFCPGDGSGTACPCGNASAPIDQEGCLNSLGTGGRLRSSGVPRVTVDNFVLFGTRMPNSSALYFQGTAQQSSGAGAAFGDGKRCAAGSIIRLGTKTNSAGASQYPAVGDLPISIRGVIPFAGATRTYQVWYRNAAAFCTASTFNLTNGLAVVWVP